MDNWRFCNRESPNLSYALAVSTSGQCDRLGARISEGNCLGSPGGIPTGNTVRCALCSQGRGVQHRFLSIAEVPRESHITNVGLGAVLTANMLADLYVCGVTGKSDFRGLQDRLSNRRTAYGKPDILAGDVTENSNRVGGIQSVIATNVPRRAQAIGRVTEGDESEDEESVGSIDPTVTVGITGEEFLPRVNVGSRCHKRGNGRYPDGENHSGAGQHDEAKRNHPELRQTRHSLYMPYHGRSPVLETCLLSGVSTPKAGPGTRVTLSATVRFSLFEHVGTQSITPGMVKGLNSDDS